LSRACDKHETKAKRIPSFARLSSIPTADWCSKMGPADQSHVPPDVSRKSWPFLRRPIDIANSDIALRWSTDVVDAYGPPVILDALLTTGRLMRSIGSWSPVTT